MLEVLFEERTYTLKEFIRNTQSNDPIIPEIMLVNILGSVIEAIVKLKRIGVYHGNISAKTIFLSDDGTW